MTLREFMHWFHAQEVLVGEGDDRRRQTLDRLREVVSTFLPDFANLRIETDPLRMLVDKAGVPLMLNQLSDGERGMLAILFDITRRLAIANPESDDPVTDGTAIVLIDEIELHLHPMWQRQVLRRFTETFVNCQFVVTTHSPLLLGEVEGKSIRFLYHDNGKVFSWTPEYALGLDANRVLEDYMGVKARDPKTAERITEMFRTIDAEDFPSARQKIDALGGIAGWKRSGTHSRPLVDRILGGRGMRAIQKGTEPTSLARHRSSSSGDYVADYDNYQHKDELRQSLVTEQGKICCYCMQRIEPTENGMKIEHWHSQRHYPTERLDYANLLGACLGGEGQPPNQQHCDTRKGESELSKNPANRGTPNREFHSVPW